MTYQTAPAQAIQECKTQDYYIPDSLLTIQNAKTIKGQRLGYLTGILYLAPADQSGVMNVCVSATIECIKACLYKAGRGMFTSVQRGRINKTVYLHHDKCRFMDQLRRDVARLERQAKKAGLVPAVRINGTSDIPWIAKQLASEYPHVMFYDYTKHPKAWTRTANNYHVTFSHSGHNRAECLEALKRGVNVSVVFTTRKGKPLPATWEGFPVIDGDEHDLRFLDPRGVVVGLRAKGKPVNVSPSPFVVLA